MSADALPELPADDAPVGDDVPVYRLVPVWWCAVIDGQWEFQSGAFDDSSEEAGTPPGMSVVLGDTLAALERQPEALPDDTVWADERYGVAVLETGFLRHQEDQEIVRDPQPDERAHGEVRGSKGSKRRKRLKAHARWVVRPATPPAS